MKLLLILTSLCLCTSGAFAAKGGGLIFVCASEDNDFKITADLSDQKGDRVAAVVDEGAKYVYPEFQKGKRKHFFNVNWPEKSKTLIDIRPVTHATLKGITQLVPGKSIITLTTDPENNHAVITMNSDGFKQTKLDAVLTTPSQEIKDQPVSCLITKWNEQ